MVIKGRLVIGLVRFFVLIQLAIASLSYEYPSVGRKKKKLSRVIALIKIQTNSSVLKKEKPTCFRWWKRKSDLSLPAAMTGSLMSSLVIGQRNSQGIPEEKESLLSSSTFLHSLLRRPTDSTHKNTRAKEHEPE